MRAHCHRWWKSAGMTDLRFRMAVRAVILDDDDRVLLCRFSAPHPAVPDGAEGVWAAPGGGVEPHENPLEALSRELREETCPGGVAGDQRARRPGRPAS